MNEEILRLYERDPSINNLYVSIRNNEIFNSQKNNVSQLINTHSMTKSIVSLMIGIALKEEHIKSLETPINHYLSGAPGHISIRDLLTMSSGFDIDDKDLYGLISNSTNWVEDILNLPLSGTGDFRYKGVDYHLLSAILSKATGLTMSNFTQIKLFSPLGINEFEWESDPQGITVGSTGLKVSFESLIKISNMLVNNGFVNRDIISSDWLNSSTNNGIPTNFRYGDYGYGWWLKTYRGNDFYQALGSGGHLILIYSKEKASIIISADTNTFNHLESEKCQIKFSILLLPNFKKKLLKSYSYRYEEILIS